MKYLFNSQIKQEISSLLADFIGVSPEQVFLDQPGKQSKVDFLVEVERYRFVFLYQVSVSQGSLLLAVNKLRKNPLIQKNEAIPLIVVPYMGETGRRLLEENGVGWLDLSGNAHIQSRGLLIHVEGKSNQVKKPGRPPNFFSPKSSRIIRQFLMEPRDYTQRELSQLTKLDEGFTSRIVRRLEQESWVVRKGKGTVYVSQPSPLLEAWKEKYEFKKHYIIKGHIPSRSGDVLLQRISGVLKDKKVNFAMTGLGAAWLLTHFAGFRNITCFLSELPNQDLFEKLGFREEERGANTWFVIPNDEGVFRGVADYEGIPCAHPIQVYLDLKEHPERATEAAEQLRQERLTWSKNG